MKFHLPVLGRIHNREGYRKEQDYMANAPILRNPVFDTHYDVGDIVEVICDHDRKGVRLNGWLRGIVVQVDSKMIAVQFKTNVYLTDGWMVPDRILWYPLQSPFIRPYKKEERKLLTDF